MRFPDGTLVSGGVELGPTIRPIFFGAERPVRLVAGPWTDAITEWSGQSLRLVALDRGEATDRGPTATLLSSAALAELASVGGADAPLDRRRFRMAFGIDDVPAYAEDGWLGREVRIGGAIVRVAGNVGRCAVTTHDPDTGRASFDTLHALHHSRSHLPTSEPLPFGVWAEVTKPGRVALGSAEPVRLVAPDRRSRDDTRREY